VFDGRPVKCGANGCNVEVACSAERPCCQDGGAAGAAGAAAGAAGAAAGGVCAHAYVMSRPATSAAAACANANPERPKTVEIFITPPW